MKASFLIAVFLISGCGRSSELTRARAAEIINSHPDFAETAGIFMHLDGIEKGVPAGFWNSRGDLIDGRGVITGVTYSLTGRGVTMAKPVKRKVTEVTGIASVPRADATLKEVRFTWEYSNVPPFVKQFVIKGGTGEVYLRLYDDGWRIEEAKLLSAPEPMPLTETDRSAAQEDLRKFQERKRAEAQAKRLAEEARVRTIVQAVTSRLRDNGDQTVSDAKTGLRWTARPVVGKNWKEAIELCRTSSVGGFVDWHMPLRSELQTIAGEGGMDFIDTPDHRFFGQMHDRSVTAPTVAESEGPDFAWCWRPGYMDWTHRGWDSCSKDLKTFALCVRRE